MATPNPRLIKALRETAKRMESGKSSYFWFDCTRCNNGQLAQTLLDKDSTELWSMLEGTERTLWSLITKEAETCQDTGLPFMQVIAELYRAGLTAKDVAEFEHLTNKRIAARAGIRNWHPEFAGFDNKRNVIVYMRAWADLLEEELGQLPASANP